MEKTNVSTSLVDSATLPDAGSRAESWRSVLMRCVRRQSNRIRTRRRIRRAVGEVKALDDRMLADVGLIRSEVEHVARHGRLPAPAVGAADDN